MGGVVKLDTRRWDRLRHTLDEAARGHARVGVFGDATADGFGMVNLAAVHEYGSPRAGVPERAPIRTALRDNQALEDFIGKLARGVVRQKMTVEKALEALGQFGATEVRKTITQGAGLNPPNAESTVEHKGSDRPLVDTGRLVQAYTHEVHR